MYTVQKTIFIICFSSIILTIYSCGPTKTEFGKSTIKKDTDTIALKKAKAVIKSIDNAVFGDSSFISKENTVLKYRLLKPKQNVTTGKYPLVIVFHGSGAIGLDNESQMGLLAKLWALPAIQKKYPAYVLVPQFPTRSSNYMLDRNRDLLVSQPQMVLESALELIDSLKNTLNVDEQRIYVVGYSMGGSTVINALSLRPDLFASGVSISGIPQFDKMDVLSNIPIWLIHGNLDTENPFKSEEQFFKEISFNKNIRFWEMDETAHNDIFSTMILGENIPKWLFSKRKQ
jgi:predicted peptidase